MGEGCPTCYKTKVKQEVKNLLIVVIAAVLSIIPAMARDAEVSVNAGAGVSGYSGETNGNLRFAYRVGVGVDVPFPSVWGLRTGLNFEQIGSKNALRIPVGDFDFGELVETSLATTTRQYYLELPVMASAGIALGGEQAVVFSFGPYLAYGVGGKSKTTYNAAGGQTEISDDVFGDGDNSLRRFDFGLGAGAELQINRHFSVGLDSRLGLRHLQAHSESSNYAIFATVGYRF